MRGGRGAAIPGQPDREHVAKWIRDHSRTCDPRASVRALQALIPEFQPDAVPAPAAQTLAQEKRVTGQFLAATAPPVTG